VFRPRRRGHVFCSSFCRYRGERPLEDRGPTDPEQVRRLFDPDRDPDQRVDLDDWHPASGLAWKELDSYDTVATRRNWYLTLREAGEL
jgi:hypothetical protein